MVYSIRERAEIIEPYFINNQCTWATSTLFSEKYADSYKHYGYILDLVAKFPPNGPVTNKKWNIEYPMRKEAEEKAVLAKITIIKYQNTF